LVFSGVVMLFLVVYLLRVLFYYIILFLNLFLLSFSSIFTRSYFDCNFIHNWAEVQNAADNLYAQSALMFLFHVMRWFTSCGVLWINLAKNFWLRHLSCNSSAICSSGWNINHFVIFVVLLLNAVCVRICIFILHVFVLYLQGFFGPCFSLEFK